jgi:hypothetical protein
LWSVSVTFFATYHLILNKLITSFYLFRSISQQYRRKSTSTTNMSDNNDSLSKGDFPVFVPSLGGIPSRRPYIVLRRGERHCKDLLEFLSKLNETVGEGEGKEQLTTCQHGFLENKIWLIARSVAELDRCRNAAVLAEIAPRLQSLKMRLKGLRDGLEMWWGLRLEDRSAVLLRCFAFDLREFDTTGAILEFSFFCFSFRSSSELPWSLLKLFFIAQTNQPSHACDFDHDLLRALPGDHVNACKW